MNFFINNLYLCHKYNAIIVNNEIINNNEIIIIMQYCNIKLKKLRI